MTDQTNGDGRRRKHNTRVQVTVAEWRHGKRCRQRSLSIHGADFDVVMGNVQMTVNDVAGRLVEPSPQSIGKIAQQTTKKATKKAKK